MRGSLWLGILLLAVTHALHAQDKPRPAERLRHAREITDLERKDLKPWHLKLAVQLLDDADGPGDAGAIEVLWAGENLQKTIFTFPHFQQTLLRTQDGSFASTSDHDVPFVLAHLLEAMLNPVPESVLQAGDKVTLYRQAFGKVTLGCISPSKPYDEAPGSKALPVPTSCFDDTEDIPRATFVHGGEAVTRNGIGKFEGQLVATSLSLQFGARQVATAHVDTLEGKVLMPDQFRVETGMQKYDPNLQQVYPDSSQGKLIEKVAPIYPAAARQSRIAGKVVLHASVAKDGHVRDLLPLASPDEMLTQAATEAVRQWKYRPLRINGDFVEVDTTITVNFAFH